MTLSWGPIYWNYLHMISLKYPHRPSRNDIKNHLGLINFFMETIPCPICRKDIKNLVSQKKLSIALKDKKSLVKYFWDIHNKVNYKLGKPILKFEKFKAIYKLKSFSNLFKAVKYNKLKNILILILISIIIFLVFLAVRKS